MIRLARKFLKRLPKGGDVNLVTSGDARRILHIEGRSINQRTFDKIVSAKLLEPIGTLLPGGTRLFLRDDVETLSKFMPKKRLPNRYSIVDYLTEATKAKVKRKD